MAIQPLTSRILITRSAGNTREFVATAATQDTAAGGSVVVTITHTPVGALAPPAPATAFEIYFVCDDGISVDGITPISGQSLRVLDNGYPSGATQTQTFHFTSNTLVTGAARCGTIEMVLRVVNSVGDPLQDYDVQSDGSPNTVPAGWSTTLDRGWIRGTTTATSALSNVAAGGAKNSPASYPDSIFHRLTLGHSHFKSVAGGTDVEGVKLDVGSPVVLTSTPTSSTTIFDATHSTVVDERFAAASASHGTAATPSNSALTGLPWTVFATYTADSMTFDPRLTASHLFQIDDDVFGTPPTSKNVTAKEMLTSQTGFMATRIVNARSEGQNGITVSQLMDPVLPGTDVGPTSGVTATQGGEAGWSPFLTWGSSKPGGTWNKTSDVTAPSTIDGNTYLLSGTDAYTMLAVNPNFRVIVNGGVATGGQTGDHWHPGETMQVAGALANFGTMDLLTPLNTAGKEPKCVIARFRDNGQVETLRADTYGSGLTAHLVTAATWVTLPDDSDPTTLGNLISLFNAESILGSGADGRVWLVQIASSVTATFDTHDLVVIARFYDSSGTPYSNSFVMDVLSKAANGHHASAFDAIAFGTSGVLSFK